MVVGDSLTKEAKLMSKTEKQKMLAGELYLAEDAELSEERARAAGGLREFNHAADAAGQMAVLQRLLAIFDPSSTIRAPFFCDYGYNISVGRSVFINFNCVFLDVMPIQIGDGCQIGPGVQIYAADHPRDAAVRRRMLESGREIKVGRNVWIGGGAILLPGVTIGDDVIVGAGSVVTRAVQAGATVVGNPARVIVR